MPEIARISTDCCIHFDKGVLVERGAYDHKRPIRDSYLETLRHLCKEPNRRFSASELCAQMNSDIEYATLGKYICEIRQKYPEIAAVLPKVGKGYVYTGERLEDLSDEEYADYLRQFAGSRSLPEPVAERDVIPELPPHSIPETDAYPTTYAAIYAKDARIIRACVDRVYTALVLSRVVHFGDACRKYCKIIDGIRPHLYELLDHADEHYDKPMEDLIERLVQLRRLLQEWVADPEPELIRYKKEMLQLIVGIRKQLDDMKNITFE